MSAERLRIVAVADTHGYHEELKVPDGDVFIHAGDMSKGGRREELELVAAWIRALPHRHKLIVAGNHDRLFESSPDEARGIFEGTTYLQDEGVHLEGVSFYGSPWQPAYNDWAFNLPRGKPLATKWAAIPEATQVLITHGPPMGIGDGDGLRLGCQDLLERVEALAPKLHVYGHIHHAGGSWLRGATRFVNVTTDECLRGPTVLDLDLR